MSPSCIESSAASNAMISPGPVSIVNAGPQIDVLNASGRIGFIFGANVPWPFIASTTNPVGMFSNAAICSGLGLFQLRLITSFGGSSIIVTICDEAYRQCITTSSKSYIDSYRYTATSSVWQRFAGLLMHRYN